jgi:hypothetical protein
LRDHRDVDRGAEPVIYRPEVLSVIGALADIVVELREIRRLLEEDHGEEEEAEEDDA